MFYQATADYRIQEKGVPEDRIGEDTRIPSIPSPSDIIHPFFASDTEQVVGAFTPDGTSFSSSFSRPLVCFIVNFKFAFLTIACGPREIIRLSLSPA